jgi:hypothetical protein
MRRGLWIEGSGAFLKKEPKNVCAFDLAFAGKAAACL